jgi:hypothetical protein
LASQKPGVDSQKREMAKRGLEQVQEKCERFSLPELRKNKEVERFAVSKKR